MSDSLNRKTTTGAVTVIPAIDLLDGRCVRLRQGNYADVTVYSDDPADMARSFERAGATRIHLVDLNAARNDGSNNRAAIRAIRKAVGACIEVGGGIRGPADISELLDAGVNRLIVGTILAREPDTTAAWIARFGACFVAGIDARDGRVKVSGWMDDSSFGDVELAQRARELGFVSLVYTNIARDGMLTGPDLERCRLVARESGLPLIVSGGVGELAHIDQAAAMNEPGIVGVIAGKAVYEGKLDLREAFARHPGQAAEDMQW